ncbi:MAG: hypothetical protein ACYCU7_07990 [Acidimicrobiales bacterium]
MAAVAMGALSAGVAPSPAAAAPAPSAAASNSEFQFSAEPYSDPGVQQRSQFTYELQPGHRILDQVVVKNFSTTTEKFLVYGEDATNVPKSGGFAYVQRSQMHNTVVGTWLTFGSTQLTVAPGTQVVDTFALSIPSDGPPGDHVGAVVVQQVEGPATPKPTGVNLVLRIAIPVFVRVVGKTYPQLTIENLKVFHDSPALLFLSGSKRVAVRFDVVNTGNVILDPKSVTVSITGLLGGTIHTYTTHQTGAAQSRANPLPLQLLPGGNLTLTEEWNGIPPFDPLTASVTAHAVDPSSTLPVSTSASTPFLYFPWIFALILLALIAGVIALIVVRRRRKARAGGTPPSQGGEPGGGGPAAPPSTSESGTLESESGTLESEIGTREEAGL